MFLFDSSDRRANNKPPIGQKVGKDMNLNPMKMMQDFKSQFASIQSDIDKQLQESKRVAAAELHLLMYLMQNDRFFNEACQLNPQLAEDFEVVVNRYYDLCDELNDSRPVDDDDDDDDNTEV